MRTGKTSDFGSSQGPGRACGFRKGLGLCFGGYDGRELDSRGDWALSPTCDLGGEGRAFQSPWLCERVPCRDTRLPQDLLWAGCFIRFLCSVLSWMPG